MTSTRLSTSKRMDHQEPLPATPDFRTHSMHPKGKEVHQSGH